MKHTSTVLEPSISFHKLVNLVDVEDIANDKIRTHDLALKLNNITNQFQTQTLHSSQQEQLMFTQPPDPNNENKPAYQKYCSYCHRTNHSFSACFKKQRDDEDEREAYAGSKSSQKSFVQRFRSPSNDRTKRYDTRCRSRSTSRTNYYLKTQIHKTDIALHQETDSAMTKILLLHNTLDHNMITTKEIPDPTVILIDLLTDFPIDMTLVIDIDHVLTQEITTILQHIHLPKDHLPDKEIIVILDRVYIQMQETNSIQYNHNIKNDPINFEVHL